MTHICVNKITIIGSDNGLLPGRRQAIIWTYDGILLIRLLGTNFSEILIEIDTFSLTKIHFQMSSGKWRPFCLGLNVTDFQTYWLVEHIGGVKNAICRRATATIMFDCPASRTTLVATRFRVAVICPIIQVPHCIRVFFYFVWFVFINHIFQFYYELCTYCNILDIYLS